jgi:hypothetical protein
VRRRRRRRAGRDDKVESIMQNLRKRLEALERSRSLKRSPAVLVVQRDAVAGQWIGATDKRLEPAMCVVLMYSAAALNAELVSDAPPRVIDVAAQ